VRAASVTLCRDSRLRVNRTRRAVARAAFSPPAATDRHHGRRLRPLSNRGAARTERLYRGAVPEPGQPKAGEGVVGRVRPLARLLRRAGREGEGGKTTRTTDPAAQLRALAAWADTTTAHGRLILTVLGGLAEFERKLIRARTGEGRTRAVRSYNVSGWTISRLTT
jgi:hypothetical protein